MILVNTHITEHHINRPLKEFLITCLDHGDILLETSILDKTRLANRLNKELKTIREKEISKIEYLEKELQKAKATVKNIDIALGDREPDESIL